MTQRPTDDELDTTLRQFLAWRAGRVAGAPDAGTVAAALESTVARGRTVAPPSLIATRGLWVVLTVLALMAALVGAALIGARLPFERPSIVRAPLSIASGGDLCCRYGLAIDDHGRIVLGHLSTGQLRLMRFDQDGRLDESFGTGGIASVDGPWLRFAVSLSVQPDGMVVVLGKVEGGGYQLARYRMDGTVDATFGRAGRTPVAFLEGVSIGLGAFVSQVATGPDGEIVVIGTTGERPPVPGGMGGTIFPDDVMFAVARFNGDGTVDPGFGTDGQIAHDVGGGRDTAYALAIQPDGRIVVVGQTGYMTPGPEDNNIAIIQLLTDGTIDPSFGYRGEVSTHVERTMNSSAGGVALGPDGRIVVIGRGLSPNAVVRYLPDGSLDASLAGDGMLDSPLAGPVAVAIQDDGKVVLISDGSSRLARLVPDGTLDRSFGAGGFVDLP